MDAQPWIESTRRRLAAAGVPAFTQIGALAVFGATGNWSKLMETAATSALTPLLGAATVGVLTLGVPLVAGLLAFLGLSAKEAAHKISLVVSVVLTIVPLVSLIGALQIAFGD